MNKLEDHAVDLEEMANALLRRLEREFGEHGIALKDADPALRVEVEKRIAEQFVRTVGPRGAGVRGPLFLMKETIKRAREIEAGRAAPQPKDMN